MNLLSSKKAKTYLFDVTILQGLDPAGPIFTYPFIAEKSERLDSTDAKNVQCLHSYTQIVTWEQQLTVEILIIMQILAIINLDAPDLAIYAITAEQFFYLSLR